MTAATQFVVYFSSAQEQVGFALVGDRVAFPSDNVGGPPLASGIYRYHEGHLSFLGEEGIANPKKASIDEIDPLKRLNRDIEKAYNDLHALLDTQDKTAGTLREKNRLLDRIGEFERAAADIIAERAEARLGPLVDSFENAINDANDLLEEHGPAPRTD